MLNNRIGKMGIGLIGVVAMSLTMALVFAPGLAWASNHNGFFNQDGEWTPTNSSPASSPGGAGGRACGLSDFQGLVTCVIDTILNPLILLIIGAALVVFLWGVLKYVSKGDAPEERSKGAALMFYGIIGLFVMVSVWGLVNIVVKSFFGTSAPTQPPVPQLSEHRSDFL